MEKIGDESSGQSIRDFVGLMPKWYSYKLLNKPSYGEAGLRSKKRAKGLQRAAVAKVRYEEFKAQLDHPEET